MVPEIPAESFRILNQNPAWSNWSFLAGEGVAFLGGSYKLEAGP